MGPWVGRRSVNNDRFAHRIASAKVVEGAEVGGCRHMVRLCVCGMLTLAGQPEDGPVPG